MNKQENNEENTHKVKENDEKIVDNSSQNTNIQKCKYPLVVYTELDDTDVADILDFCVGVIEKYSDDNEKSCKIIKENLDKKYSPHWNIVIGSNHGCDIDFESKNILYFYFGISNAVLIWKCNYKRKFDDE